MGPASRAALLAALALAAGPLARAPADEGGGGSMAARDAFLGRLVPLLLDGIAREDTEHPVFHGCVDWHSAVHGHWALLRIARTTGAHAEAAERADRSLAPEALAEEAEALRASPRFEMPYGRAWFLRLATEHESWSREHERPDPDRLRPLAREIARSLRDHLAATTEGPEAAEYASTSWALAQLRAWAASTGDVATAAWASKTVRERFLGPAEGVSFAEDARRPEFFSRFGGWAYLVATSTDAETLAAFLEARPISDGALAPVKPQAGAVHHLGMNWSRAWALGALARRAPEASRERFRRAFAAHVEAGMRDHDRHAGDVWAYDHWVPQFAVYALTDGS